ncbi:MAG: hypothetical protein KF914_20500 [Rhizobiaceae bacterium]|nr:hypothetical protein [Rhizobiaceae bacterium]
MKHIVGFAQAPGQRPFYAYESDSGPQGFAVGSKVLASPPGQAPRWLQVTSVGYQLHAEAVVTTVVVNEATRIGGDGEDFAVWPWPEQG